MKMPQNRDDYEWMLLRTFYLGMQRGYHIKLTYKTNQKREALLEEALLEFAKEYNLERTTLD